MAESIRLPVDGIRLAVTDHAPGRTDRRAMVLAHATGFCRAVWDPVVEAFRERFRVVVYDQRGHGDSDKPDGAYEWRTFVSDLAALIRAMDLRGVIGVGHSMGGASVAGVAADFPSLVGTAVLIDPVLVPRLDPESRRESSSLLAAGARRRRMVWESHDQMFETYARRPAFAAWRSDVLRAYVERGSFVRDDGRVELLCPGEIEARVFDAASRSASLDYVSRIEQPTLLVAGGSSPTLPVDLARQAASMLRRGRLETLPGVGHFVPMEAPERVVESMRGFL